MKNDSKLKVSVVQSQPAETLDSTIRKIGLLASQAVRSGSELICFPELFIPKETPISVESKEFEAILNFAKDGDINIVLGLAEASNGRIYNSQVIINNSGDLVLNRKKFLTLKKEELSSFSLGESSDLVNAKVISFKTAGDVEVGTLVGDEHLDPRLTYNSATQQEKIHVGLFSSLDSYDVKSLHSVARAYAMQAQTIFILPSFSSSKGPSGTAIFGADGTQLTDTLRPSFEGSVTIELDLSNSILLQKQLVDVVGHYSRTDLISLDIKEKGSTSSTGSFVLV